MPSPSATHTALADRTRIAALRTATTHSGSKVALRTNAPQLAVGRMSGIAGPFRWSLWQLPFGGVHAPAPVSGTGVRGPIVPDRSRDCTYYSRRSGEQLTEENS